MLILDVTPALVHTAYYGAGWILGWTRVCSVSLTCGLPLPPNVSFRNI